MHSTSEFIHHILDERFHPLTLTVTDDSAKHAGHAGSRPEGQTHFTVTIVSEKFTGLSRIARHRLIYDALGDLFARGLHALAIHAFTPKEIEEAD